ncbi:flagellar assembly protein FliW [Kurthia sibirica]|uniref:Flagellar assembly factor FliW n=1 Tax=Kurthia sibirica TaxID=202750 RepID=A0A2U3AMN0_9BACL|nr:flagellar assembly protein FliW [Kurthia sibirica]PWI25793.1 flagellar assembly protein FliW [Kurthia sibirica]GEK35093.1 flagellar assembly factor FliW [Kurthia sibirica]
MNIQTKFSGEISIAEEAIIKFPDGIPAFESEQEFVLIPLQESSPFIILQSVKTPEIGFIMAYPYEFKEDYAFDLTKEDQKILELENPNTVLIYSILTLKDSLEKSTMNLLAPIVINSQCNIGKQIILNESTLFPLQYPLKKAEGSTR